MIYKHIPVFYSYSKKSQHFQIANILIPHTLIEFGVDYKTHNTESWSIKKKTRISYYFIKFKNISIQKLSKVTIDIPEDPVPNTGHGNILWMHGWIHDIGTKYGVFRYF